LHSVVVDEERPGFLPISKGAGRLLSRGWFKLEGILGKGSRM